VGRLLAEEHASNRPSGEGHRLVDYAEAERDGGWSLRSSLVRFAQPEPVRASAVLELVRRTDATLGPSRNLLERDTVATDPDLSSASFAVSGDDVVRTTPSRRWGDSPAADLARLRRRWPEVAGDAVRAYTEVTPLDDALVALVDPLSLAVALDDLAGVLVEWSVDRSLAAPLDAVDACCRDLFAEMERLGIPRETGDPAEWRRRARR
jgi:hypothetical protein